VFDTSTGGYLATEATAIVAAAAVANRSCSDPGAGQGAMLPIQFISGTSPVKEFCTGCRTLGNL